jgi:hypothetical protein
MTTARDLITLASKDAGVLGVGQTMLAEDMNDQLRRLNMMIAQWQTMRFFIWHLVNLGIATTGQEYYTAGAGGEFNLGYWPNKIESAFLRITANTPQSQQVDFPIQVMNSREDYDRIALKGLQSFSQYIWLDTSYPLAKVYAWPIPSANIYELHVTFRALLSQFASLDTVFAFPPEYEAAIHYNLAVRIRAGYRLPADLQLNDLASQASRVVREANAQIPRLTMPDNLVRPGVYNIYSDQVR